MERNKKIGFLMVVAFVVGVLFTVIVTSQLNLPDQVVASAEDRAVKSTVEKNDTEHSSISQQQQDFIAKMNSIFAQAAEKVKPSIVTVYSEKIVKYYYRSPFDLFFDDELFQQFFGRRRQQPEGGEQQRVQTGMGSGVIVKSDGTILTNHHVIKDADDIRVKTVDGEEYEAEIVGKDPKTDLAVIRIKADNLQPAKLGDSDKLIVGEWVLAIGNPFSEQLRYTVTKGIVSATGRKGLGLAGNQGYENFIQTDAPINPGNSGGALVNLYGEVIGINTAIVTPSGGFAGVGFAIPINMARRVMNDLITKGKVVRGFLGVSIQNVDKDMAKSLGLKGDQGAIVVEVTPDGPAEDAGIKPSDIIIEFDGKKVKNADHLKFLVADIPPGEKVEVVVNRDGDIKRLQVEIDELPGESSTASTVGAAEKIGIKVANVTAELARQYDLVEGKGVLVVHVDPTKNAFRKGIREGDLILQVNRIQVNNVEEFNARMKSIKPGKVPVLFLIKRGSGRMFVAVEIPE